MFLDFVKAIENMLTSEIQPGKISYIAGIPCPESRLICGSDSASRLHAYSES